MKKIAKKPDIIIISLESLLSLQALHLFFPWSQSIIWVLLFILFAFFYSKNVFSQSAKEILIAAGILSFFYACMVFFSVQIHRNGAVFFDIRMLLSSVCLFFLFFRILSAVFTRLLSTSFNTQGKGATIGSSWILLIALALILFWSPYLVACFPGNLTSDSIGEIRQQLGLSPLSNHHPVIHQLMIKACLLLTNPFGSISAGVSLYIVLQMVTMAVIFSLCLVSLVKNGVSKRLVIAFFAFYALFTIHGFYVVTMYKDVPFAGITLLLMLLLGNELREDFSSFNRKKLLRILGLIFLSFLFCTVRNNGYYAFVIGFVPLLFFQRKSWKKLLLVFLSTILLVNAYNYIIFEKLEIRKSETGEMLGIPLQMLARVVKEENPDLSDEDFLILQDVIPDYSVLAAHYTPDNSDPIKGNGVFLPHIFDANPSIYLKSWLKIGLKYPRTYLDAFLLQTCGFWDPLREYSSISASVYPNEFNIAQSTATEPLRAFLINFHMWASTQSPVSVFYSIGFLVMLFLFSFALLWLKGQKSVACPIFILAALWITSAGAPLCLYQYVYGLTVSIPFFLALSVSLPVKQEAS